MEQSNRRSAAAHHPQAQIPFRAFDDRREVRIYHHGLLPHWRQEGCTYFVTFRQADSLPVAVARALEQERNQWLARHGIDAGLPDWKRRFASLAPNLRREFARAFTQRLDEFLDAGHGSCVLRTPSASEVVTNALMHFQGERVWTGDFVIMPNHVHALMTPMPECELEDVLQSIKSYTANQINKALGHTGILWQRESYDHIVRDPAELEAFQLYIAGNPQKAGLPIGQFVHVSASYSFL